MRVFLPIPKHVIGIIWKAFLLLTCFALFIDSYRNQQSFFKLTGVDSSTLFLIAMIFTYFIRTWDIAKLPNRILRFFHVYLFPLSTVAGVGFTLAEALTYPNFIYSITRINYQPVAYIAILTGWILFWHTRVAWRRRNQKILIFRSGWILLGLAWLISLWPQHIFVRLSEENHFVENVQVITLVVGGIFAFRIGRKLFHTKHVFSACIYVLGAIGLFAVAGDEIAWGQRFLGLTPSDFFQANNIQQEITVHNLKQLASSVGYIYMAIGLWGWVSWVLAEKLKKSLPPIARLFVSRWYLFPYFYCAFLYNFRTALGPHTIGTWSEVMELMLYLGVSLFLIQVERYGSHPPLLKKSSS